MPDVKIFGERHTSTNAIKAIIEENSESRCVASTRKEIDPQFDRRLYVYLKLRKLGPPIRELMLARIRAKVDRLFADSGTIHAWKHCATYFDAVDDFSELFIVFTVRHPASWLVSLFRKPQVTGHKPRSISEFIDFDWKTFGREHLEKRSYTPLELLQEKVKSYRAFQDKLDAHDIPHAILKFEDIVLHQSEVFRSIADHLRNPRDDFQPLVRSTKDANKSLNDYIAYYGDERWRDEIVGLEDRINDIVDWDLFRPFGYSAV